MTIEIATKARNAGELTGETDGSLGAYLRRMEDAGALEDLIGPR